MAVQRAPRCRRPRSLQRRRQRGHADRAGYTNQWFHSPDRIGVALSQDIDEITLAFTADAWARSKRSKVYAVAGSTEPLSSRSGLNFLPDYTQASTDAPPVLPPITGLPGQALDRTLEGIAQRYGHRTAFLVALEFEYASYQ